MSSGTLTINDGTFIGGTGGTGTSILPSGTATPAFAANGSGTVVNIYGGSFAIGSGFGSPPALSVGDNAVVNFFTQPGTFVYDGFTVSGVFLNGQGFVFTASSSGGGTFQEASPAVVPEVGTFALVLSALALGFVVVRRRK